ncbi:MAG TPA: glycoside hydrolase family 16 protein [Acidisarcina sp.]|nr:glycoside hydrolase family 16 protein [Acidisarcina sp.]
MIRKRLLPVARLILCLGCGGVVCAAPLSPATQQEALLWSEDFNATAPSAPNPAVWTFDTGVGGWGNHELEHYCAYGSSKPPCDPAQPNSFVGTDGYLHIVARKDARDNYTSARIRTKGLKSFQYGRIEARIKMPVGQGIWPAFWMLGDRISSVGWPACGEQDIMETIGSTPSVNHGSVHGPGFTGGILGQSYTLPGTAKFSDDFHIYGMIWTAKKIAYYIDSPGNVYATFTPDSLPAGAVWPFDNGKAFFILNVAVGGDWPGPPNATTVFPQEMLVDYVRVWSAPAK